MKKDKLYPWKQSITTTLGILESQKNIKSGLMYIRYYVNVKTSNNNLITLNLLSSYGLFV